MLLNLEEEVVIDELLLNLLGHPSQWIVDTLVISTHFLQEHDQLINVVI